MFMLIYFFLNNIEKDQLKLIFLFINLIYMKNN